jgi:hypothetical protein
VLDGQKLSSQKHGHDLISNHPAPAPDKYIPIIETEKSTEK